MKRAFTFLSIHSLSALASLLICAQSASAHVDAVHSFQDKNGERISFQIHEALSLHSEREIIIEQQEIRTLRPDSVKFVLIGRDLDGDGKFDAWFYMGKEGSMESLEMPSVTQDGWDAAQVILRDHVDLKNRWLAQIWFTAITSYTFMTQSTYQKMMKKIYYQQVDLLDFEIRTKRLERINPRNPALLQMYLNLSDGWAEIANEADVNKIYYSAVADVVMYAGVLSKIGGKAMQVVLSPLQKSEMYVATAEFFGKFIATSKGRAAAALERVNFLRSISAKVTEAMLPATMLKLAATERVGLMIEGLAAQGKIQKLIAHTLIFGGDYAKGAIKNGGYIAWTQSLQLISEIYNRWGIRSFAHPIILKQKVLSDKELLHDLAYMTMETTITSTMIDRNGNGLKGFSKAGLFSMVDSNAMTYFSQGSLDPKRAAFDTGWEVGVGNTQTLIDLKTLNYFEQIANKTGNRQLKLVGYLVTGADQFFGYKFYGSMTEWIKDPKAPEFLKKLKSSLDKNPITLVPIFAPV